MKCFSLFALRKKQGRTKAVEAKEQVMQDERKMQTPFKNIEAMLLVNKWI
jgi:hypothetical protein